MKHHSLKQILTFVLISLFTASPFTQAATINIDFDSVGVSSTTGMGDPSGYLSGFGISLSQTYALTAQNPFVPTLSVIDDRYIYTGWNGVGPDPALYLQASSARNVFSQYGNNGPLTFNLGFASALSSFSFKSVGIGPASQSTSFPAWAAEAYDASNNVLDSVFQNFAVNRITSTFTLSTADFLIDHVTFFRDGTRSTAVQNWTAYSHVILDDLVLTQANVPEPATLALLGLGLMGLGIGFLKKKVRDRIRP